MKLTNHHGLPDTFYQAVLNDKYSDGGADYTATTLINPVRVTLLGRRHQSELVEDVAERIWVLLGKSAHAILEAAAHDNALQEERLFARVAGRTLSGAADLYHDGVVSDYKITSMWTRVYGSRKSEWTQQTNIYAYLYRQAGFEVTGVRVICIYRDWSAGKAQLDTRLPAHPVEVLDLPLWCEAKQEHFIAQRVERLKAGEALPDHALPPCSPEEMWAKPDKFAVLKPGRKAALKLCSSAEEATAWQREHPGTVIEPRPGTRTRCEQYCAVSRFCTQYTDYLLSSVR